MLKRLLTLTLVGSYLIAPACAGEAFERGWKIGWAEGWKHVKGQNAFVPFIPFAPSPQFSEEDSFRGGHDAGFLAGIERAEY